VAEKEPEVCWYHDRNSHGKIPAAQYARHYCPKCERCDIIAVCAACADTYERQIKRNGNYPWACETCGSSMQRRLLGRV
jgi:ribosomal protein L37AE/L43A